MKIRLAEWVSFFLSLGIILGMAGYLIVDIAREKDEQVQIEVEVLKDRVKTAGNRLVATVLVHNRSRKAAKQVKITALEREFEFDYLPARATEKLLLIGTEADLANLRAEPVSYLEK